MLSSWFATKEKTRFESTPEFKSLNHDIDKIKKQAIALEKAAKSVAVGSTEDLKCKVFKKLVSELDEHIVAFNKLPESNDIAEQDLQKRRVILQLKLSIDHVQHNYWQEINTERSGVKRVLGTAAMFSAAVAPIAACAVFPPAGLSLLGEVAVGATAGIGGIAMADAVEERVRPTSTYSTELLYSVQNVIDRTYTSLAFDLTQKQRDSELNQIQDPDSKSEVKSHGKQKRA